MLKAGKFERMSLTGNSHPKMTGGSRVSRAPPQYTLPAFRNLHGTNFWKLKHSLNSDCHIKIRP